MATTISVKNINQPAPKWLRVTLSILNTVLVGGVLTGAFSAFNIPDQIQLKIGALLGLAQLILRAILANGEKYSIK
jgi:hypothetical protein